MRINCCKINNVPKNKLFDADKFAEWLTSVYNSSSFKSWEDVSKAVKKHGGQISRSSLSRYAGAKDQTLTGKPSQPQPQSAIALAKVFNEDEDKVLMLCGHAPKTVSKIPDFVIETIANTGTLSNRDWRVVDNLIRALSNAQNTDTNDEISTLTH